MKKRTPGFPLVLAGLLSVMFIVSCGKEGPAGAEGPAGPPGPKGDGVANDVIYSSWLNVTYEADTIHTAGGTIDTVGYYASIDVPQLTQAMLNTADVKIYINANEATDPEIYPLPLQLKSGLYIQVSVHEKTISLYSNSNMSTVFSQGKYYQQYRYMIVPGNAEVNSASQVKWPEYETVKAYFKLED